MIDGRVDMGPRVAKVDRVLDIEAERNLEQDRTASSAGCRMAEPPPACRTES